MEKLNELVEHSEDMRKRGLNAVVEMETILAIAEELRELEQRAEAAEAKLAGLEKQEPVLFRDSQGCFVSKGKGERLIESEEYVTPYYLRPAPAINLADLVPDEKGSPLGTMDYDICHNDGWNECRAAILRNIEEANGQTIPAAKVGSVADTEVQAGSEEASDEGESK